MDVSSAVERKMFAWLYHDSVQQMDESEFIAVVGVVAVVSSFGIRI